MRDIRDSVSDAIDRTLEAVKSKPAAVQALYAAKRPAHDPALPAEPDSSGGIEALLQRAKAQLAAVEDGHVHGELIHTSDPDLALMMSALESASSQGTTAAATAGGVVGVHKYDETDPHWILSVLNTIVDDKVPFREPAGPDDCEVQLEEKDISIGLAGDWGTGLYSSNQIAWQIAQRRPDVTIHLGDVYYSGTEEEVQKKFVSRWPRGTFGTFALNSNHEMYAGGHGYFKVTLANPDFAVHQQKSFFSLFNSTWQIIGLDSAYDSEKAKLYQNGVLRQSQLDWFTAQLAKAKAAGRRAIVLTHHNPISVNGGDPDHGMINQIAAAAGRAQATFDYWFFGHEHAVAVFEPMQWGGGLVKPRCIGHGGIPYYPGSSGDKGGGIRVQWTETGTYAVGKGDPRCGLNGFSMLTLPLSGAEVLESYYDDSGNLRYATGVRATISIRDDARARPGKQAG